VKRATSLEDRLFEETKRAEALANVVPAGEERDQFLKKIRQANSAAHTSWLTSPGLKSRAVFCGTRSCSPFLEPAHGSAVRDSYCVQEFEETIVRVLVVEDDPLIREFVVEVLREEGFEVIHASDGEEALAWCKRRVADVLVTDITLPGEVDGWQIAERCREHHPGLPVIYATGFSPVAPRPVDGSLLLQKPYHPEEIVQAVRQITESRPT
jgi:CheY-like chemotaxis protein